MGHHIDPDTLKFLDWLKIKGESLSYIAELEYPLAHKKFVDVVWKLSESQSPLVTFEVETKDGRVIFCNTAKIYGPSVLTVPKPWHHFMIIYKGHLSAGHKDSLFNLINQNNVHLFEDIFGTPKNLKKLEQKLENLKYDVSERIKKELQNKPLGDTLTALIEGVSDGLSGGPLGKPEITLTYKSADSPKPGIPCSITVVTRKGEPTFIDKLNESTATRKPFTIKSPQLRDFMVNGKHAFSKNSGKATLTLIPQPIWPVKIAVPKTNIVFENILLRLIKTNEAIDYLSTEDRNLPYIFNFMVDRIGKKNRFGFEFKSEKANVKQALKFEELMNALNKEKTIVIVNQADGRIIFIFHIRQNIDEAVNWYYLLSKLVYIQEKTHLTIKAPIKITQKDVKDIFDLINIIDTGQKEILIEEITWHIDKNGAKKIIAFQKEQGKISDLTISQEAKSTLFDQVIPMGKTTMHLPAMQFSLSIEDVEKLVEATADNNLVELSIKPVSDKKTIIKFEDWQPKK
jgi:hypothetical protein